MDTKTEPTLEPDPDNVFVVYSEWTSGQGAVVEGVFRTREAAEAWAKDVRVLDPNKHRFLISTCMARDRRGKLKCLLSIFPGMYA